MHTIVQLLRKMNRGVTWQNPLVNLAVHALDPLDWGVRRRRGLGHLPPYSVRVRSNGLRNQFGGRQFSRLGKLLSSTLRDKAGVEAKSRVLEIGCGCGRTALALTDVLDDGNYVGMDIESVALDGCNNNERLRQKRFRFDLKDVYSREYNPTGRLGADSYSFPYGNSEFDVVFLVSVFTHMKPGEVSNYIAEISRMLSNGGRCLVTTFLMDHGYTWDGLSFPYELGECRVYRENFPELAVGYQLDFFEREFAKCGMQLASDPMLGKWRASPDFPTTTAFGQDVLVFAKTGSANPA